MVSTVDVNRCMSCSIRLLTTLDNLTNSVTPDLSTDDLSLTSPNIAVFVRRVTLLNISRILCTVHSSTKDQQSHFSELQLSCSPLFHSMENQPLWNEVSVVMEVDRQLCLQRLLWRSLLRFLWRLLCRFLCNMYII